MGDTQYQHGPTPVNPLLRAGLALSGINTWVAEGTLPPEAEDGLLTAEDVSGLDLLATELVVLSACETGLGEVRTGDGSLIRGVIKNEDTFSLQMMDEHEEFHLFSKTSLKEITRPPRSLMPAPRGAPP